MAEEKESIEEKETEVVAEEGEEGISSLSPAERIKRLKEKLEACRKERQEYLEHAQRYKADYLNLKREFSEERLNLLKFANEDLLRELIELADTFELAFANKHLWEAVNEDWRKGVEQIYAKLLNIFRQSGLAELNPLGEKFDPTRHHSIMAVDTSRPEEDNLVVEVVQKGYILNGRLIRPAQVKIGHLK